MKTFPSSRRAQRGSLLIVAMLLCAVIGISLASYLTLGRTGLQLSNRALYNNAAMNLAENGLEQAVFALNKTVADPTYNWSYAGWTPVDTTDARQKWENYNFGQGATGEVRAYVYNYQNGASPKIITRSIVSLGGGSSKTIEKWIEVQLRKTSKFANGLVAKQTISFSGTNASVNSWNSDPDNNPATAAIPYSAGVKHDKGSVGSISVAVNSVLVNNADIWGYAATGGALPSVGSNGLIGPFGTASGTMNMANVSTDFAASFDPVTAPPGAYSNYGGAITDDLSLPRAGIDNVAADGYYYIEADSINYTNKTLTITNKVILKLNNVLTGIDIGGGSGALNINAGAELQVYTAGSIKIAGQGLMNGGTTAATANQPSKCQIYGTKTVGSQDIDIAGNGALVAVVYAPQGSVKINGNGDVCGSVVANDIKVVGNAAFHYDEALANFGGLNPYRVSKWKELTTEADRAANLAVVNW
jgi:hypothetical protein